MKYITRTIKASILNVHGINIKSQSLETVAYLFDGDFENATDKDISNVKKAVTTAEFKPAYVEASGKAIEKKYAISLEDFMKYAHIVSEDEKVDEA